MRVIFEGGGLNGEVVRILDRPDLVDARDSEETVQVDESVGLEGEGESVIILFVAAPNEVQLGDDTGVKTAAVLVEEGGELGGGELGGGSHGEGLVVARLVMVGRRYRGWWWCRRLVLLARC